MLCLQCSLLLECLPFAADSGARRKNRHPPLSAWARWLCSRVSRHASTCCHWRRPPAAFLGGICSGNTRRRQFWHAFGAGACRMSEHLSPSLETEDRLVGRLQACVGLVRPALVRAYVMAYGAETPERGLPGLRRACFG